MRPPAATLPLTAAIELFLASLFFGFSGSQRPEAVKVFDFCSFLARKISYLQSKKVFFGNTFTVSPRWEPGPGSLS
jgi:hypothetical protein